MVYLNLVKELWSISMKQWMKINSKQNTGSNETICNQPS